MAPPPVMVNQMMPSPMMMPQPVYNPMGGVTTTSYQTPMMGMGYGAPAPAPMMTTTTYNTGYQPAPFY